MKIAIQGNKAFDSYEIFLRAMGTALNALSKTEDKEFLVFTAGPMKISDMARGFLNISEDTLRSHGVKSKLIKVPPKWIKDHLPEIEYMIYFAMPKEPLPEIIELCNRKDMDNLVYRQY